MDIYKDIASRTKGEIYIGVVGPVRTGKSTFIKRFMDLCVIPYLTDVHQKERTIDELPQSAYGKTIMTTEPKFVPQNAATIRVEEKNEVRVRLIDCVGFVVEGAEGHMEGADQRMVRTPWSEEEVPFAEAARIGTLKVIREHATIGVVVTTDGSFGELERENYIEAEEETIREMEETAKPYVILLNSEHPLREQTQTLRMELEEKYGRPVVAMNVKQMQKSDVIRLLESVLLEFPIVCSEFYLPKWTETLPKEHPIKEKLISFATHWVQEHVRMRDLSMGEPSSFQEGEICQCFVRKIRMEDGTVELKVEVADHCYYEFLSELTRIPIRSEYRLILKIRELVEMQSAYERVAEAMESVENNGYGVVKPKLSEIRMEEPELITHGGRYGVKIRATSPSIHMIRANIETEIAPIVGSREQAEDLINYISQGKNSKEGVWGANIFGKSLGELMEDGIRDKIARMDEECQNNLQNTMQKLVNENSGGMVCIII